MGSIRRKESRIETPQGEIDFGERVPRLESGGLSDGGALELGQGGIMFAHGVVKRGVFDEGLDFFGAQAMDGSTVRPKRKDGLVGRPERK